MVLGTAGGVTLVAPAQAKASVPAVRKIAIVDLQRVLSETKAGRNARKTLEASAKAKQRKLEKRQQELQANLEKAQRLAGPELAAAQERLQREYMEMQQTMFTLQQDLAQQEAKLLETMYTNSQRIVTKLAKSRNYDLVLVRDPGTILHANEGLDITSEVVKLYNKAHTK